jgi:cytochrome c5
MRSGYSFVAMTLLTIIITLAALTLVLRNSEFTPPETVASANPPSAATKGQVDKVEVQDKPGTLVSGTTETLPLSQATPAPDGSAILEDRCARCHAAQWLAEIEGSRLEWEKVLVRMEMKGLRLSDTEKDVLLDYLAAAGRE